MITENFTESHLTSFGQMNFIDAISLAESYSLSGDIEKTISIYESWIRNNHDKPLVHVACFNYASALTKAGRNNHAKVVLEEVIKTVPDFIPPYINLGHVYESMGLQNNAIKLWSDIIERLDNISAENINYKLIILKQLARLQVSLSRLSEAEVVLLKSASILSTQRDIIQHLVVMRQRQCKWPAVSELSNISPDDILKSMAPVSLGAYIDDPLFLLAGSYIHNKEDIHWSNKIRTVGSWSPPRTLHKGPLRIGYLSSDFRHHAIGFLMAGVFELHDRNAVEVFVYYCGPHSPDYVQERIKNSVDHWIDINPMNDETAARCIIDDRIDILVDINGYTNFSRTNLLELKPAPIIVNWLGYPGTMASPYHDYIIADDFIIPPEYEIFYSERVMRLPCYQPNDRKRIVPPRPLSRAAAGLPEDAIVYCCFNGLQKVTPLIFKCWMTILQHVPNSVLWLLADNPEDRERLRQHARDADVSPDRLCFVGWASNVDHLARYHFADVILDTWPYGAHTTASDSLWMGVPIVTLAGRSFASRVCGSLARAAGVGELVCKTREDYIFRAVTLGRDKDILKYYKDFLHQNRYDCTLFDTAKLVNSLETIFSQMYQHYTSGNIVRPNLMNLDIYHEVGAELSGTEIDGLSDEEYFKAWRRQLAYRDSFIRIPPDGRLWNGTDGFKPAAV